MARYTIEHGFTPKRTLKRPILAVGILLSIGSAGYFLHDKSPSASVPSTPISSSVSAAPAKKLNLQQPITWPSYGQSAYGVTGEGVLANSSSNKPAPTASLAKIITALAILKAKPLQPGEQGPSITITQEDIAIYENYVRNDGTVVPVEVGEQISEYQALQAILLPSSNNISDALVRWAFGSNEAYITYANQMLKDMGLNDTYVADASGFSASTTSTAHDMTQLGLSYIQNPILKEIAQQREATIPFAGLIRNYNSVVNKDGIIGIKVGFTDEAGRCFVVVDTRANGKSAGAVTIMGAPDIQTAMNDAVSVMGQGNAAYDDAVSKQP